MTSGNMDTINMQYNNNSEQIIHSSTNYVNNNPWWSSTGSHIPQSLPGNFHMAVDPLRQHGNQIKDLQPQMPDQDSSSTQSTDQSHQELSGTSEGNPQEQSVSTQSGNDSTNENHAQGHMNPALSLRNPEAVPQPATFGYNPAGITPYPYADPYYGGVLPPYASQAMIHPQMMGVSMPTSSRIPLPYVSAEEDTIYVNPKQYQAILRRRERRAKLEAQNKLIKERKPYLHESRHIHATKRARGVGGRFLNTKKLENSGTAGSVATPTCSNVSNSGSGQFQNPNDADFRISRIPITR